MDVNNSVNPSESEPGVVLSSDRQTVLFSREPPPPYSSEISPTAHPITREVVLLQGTLKSGPTFYNCLKCNQRVLTEVEYINTNKTHLIAGFICGFTFWCLLCCLAAIPYLTKPCKEALHYCPNCKTFLGAYSKL